MGLVVVELETHAAVDLVILEGDVVLVDLVSSGAGLGGNELLEITDSVVLVALQPHLLPQPVVREPEIRRVEERDDSYQRRMEYGSKNSWG